RAGPSVELGPEPVRCVRQGLARLPVQKTPITGRGHRVLRTEVLQIDEPAARRIGAAEGETRAVDLRRVEPDKIEGGGYGPAGGVSLLARFGTFDDFGDLGRRLDRRP